MQNGTRFFNEEKKIPFKQQQQPNVSHQTARNSTISGTPLTKQNVFHHAIKVQFVGFCSLFINLSLSLFLVLGALAFHSIYLVGCHLFAQNRWSLDHLFFRSYQVSAAISIIFQQLLICVSVSS